MENNVSEYKYYAREAKKRMKDGFWANKLNEWNLTRDNAENEGRNADKDINLEKRLLIKRFYFPELYWEEEQLYKRVCEFMENKETVVNPIKILCEEAGVYKLPPEKRPQRVLEISKDYRKMLKRYEEEKGIK